jgi:hypothetical protein
MKAAFSDDADLKSLDDDRYVSVGKSLADDMDTGKTAHVIAVTLRVFNKFCFWLWF